MRLRSQPLLLTEEFQSQVGKAGVSCTAGVVLGGDCSLLPCTAKLLSVDMMLSMLLHSRRLRRKLFWFSPFAFLRSLKHGNIWY